MMAYPLYTSLCGSEHLSQIAVLDIAGLLFGFSVYMGMLGQTENGGKISAKALFFSAVKTPAFVASVLGIVAGLTGIISRLVESSFGGVYLSVENILTTSVTSMILLVVGYSMELTRELISPCIKTIILRICVQAVMMAGVSSCCPFSCRQFTAYGSCNHSVYVCTGYFQYADIPEEKRKQCICIYYKFFVLYCVNSGIYGAGVDDSLERYVK